MAREPKQQSSRDTPIYAGRAGKMIVIILAVAALTFFALRQFWHAEEQRDEPQSQTAPAGP